MYNTEKTKTQRNLSTNAKLIIKGIGWFKRANLRNGASDLAVLPPPWMMKKVINK